MYATHQIAKYSSDPRQSHGKAILYLVCYLKKTRNLGLKFKPDPKKGFECYCDANFSGNWNKVFAAVDPSTAKSWSGWIIFCAGCPITWASKLQSQVALSTTEAEYIAMSQSLRAVIPVMNLLEEMREQDSQVICTKPHVYCKVFEDNSGALELTMLPKLHPRTKHINVCYHHFCKHVRKRLIKIFPIRETLHFFVEFMICVRSLRQTLLFSKVWHSLLVAKGPTKFGTVHQTAKGYRSTKYLSWQK